MEEKEQDGMVEEEEKKEVEHRHPCPQFDGILHLLFTIAQSSHRTLAFCLESLCVFLGNLLWMRPLVNAPFLPKSLSTHAEVH